MSGDLRQARITSELVKFSATATDIASADHKNAISAEMNRR